MELHERSRVLMHTLVLVDSEFGNTYRLAETIAGELRSAGQVDVINVRAPASESQLPTDLDMVIVGGPTQVHGVSKPLTDYLDALPPRIFANLACASFDTRVRGWPLLTGAASGGISKRLNKMGAHRVMPPESFLVAGKEGPLLDGELERARTWAKHLVAAGGPEVAPVMAR
jgi:flavodoxin